MFDYIENGAGNHLGITMVLDKGMGLGALDDLLAVAGSFVQVVKFGWGTTVVYDPELVREKTRRIRQRGIEVCPGGTLFELAYARRAVDPFLDEVQALGFSAVEISDGTVEMPQESKLAVIRQVRERGLIAISEVGKKTLEEDSRLRPQDRIHAIRQELEAGSWKVILEARESGSLGIFDREGEVKESFVDELVAAVDPDQLIFEAPRKAQQVWLIRRFGSGVHLGNIPPEDLVSVETLRRGLRADTSLDLLLKQVEVRIDLGVEGAVAAAARGDVVVVIDCLRASSTIVTALSSGVAAVIPCRTVDEGLGAGKISAGERGGKKIPGFTHGNSPLEIQAQGYQGVTLHLSTTNGTECLQCAARGASAVLVGCLLNAKAVATAALRAAQSAGRNITLVTPGRHNREALEDTIGATEIAHYLNQGSPRGVVKPYYSDDYVADFMASGTGQNLIGLGYSADVVFCAVKDRFDLVPVYRNGEITPLEPA